MNPVNRPELKSKIKKELIRRLDATEEAYIALVQAHSSLQIAAQDAFIRLVCVLAASGGQVDVTQEDIDALAPIVETEVHVWNVGTEENPMKRFSLTPEPTDAE